MKRVISILLSLTMLLAIFPINNLCRATENVELLTATTTDELDAENLQNKEVSFSFMEVNKEPIVTLFSDQDKNRLNDTVRYTVLVLDTSGSASFSNSSGAEIYKADTAVEYVKQAAKKFSHDILKADGKNYVAVVSYKSTAQTILDFTDDYENLSAKLDLLTASDTTRDMADGLRCAETLINSITDENAVKNVVLCTTGMTNNGDHNYDGHYDSNTIGSIWHRQDTNIRLYAYANVAYNVAEKIKEKATLYSLGLFQTMMNMPDEGKSIAEFFKLSAKDMATSEEYFYNVEDPNDIEFQFGEIVDNITQKENKFKFGGYLVQSEDTEATYYYDDAYFYGSARDYNAHLATMSLCFELTTWSSFEGEKWTKDVNHPSPKFINARNLLIGDINNENDKGLGFDSFAVNDFWDAKPTKDSIGAVAAKKVITDDNNKSYTLIALGIRGGGYEQEWASNFTMGKEGEHDGFATAKDNVIEFLKKYITENNVSGDIKLWIVGFSRAGAVTNMVAGDLNKDQYALQNNTTLLPENLYAYTFEAPQGVLREQVDGDYSNIHNVINVNDIVPLVAPSIWDFARYNTDEWLPSAYKSTFKEDIKKMKEFYDVFKNNAILVNNYKKEEDKNKVEYRIKEYATRTDIVGIDITKILPGGAPFFKTKDYDIHTREVLTDGITFLADGAIGDREIYYYNLQAGIRTVMAAFMGGASWNDAITGGTLTFDVFLERVCKELTLEKTIEILSPIFAFSLDTPQERLDKVDENISHFVGDMLDDSDLWGNVKFTLEIKNTLITLIKNVVMEIANECLNKNITPLRSVGDIINLARSDMDLFQAHHPEICLSWLMSMDDNYTKNVVENNPVKSCRIIHINCPVDVQVYDSNNNLVTEINDDIAENKVENIVAYVNSEGEKIFTLPIDENYNIIIQPTEDGTLSYSVNEVDIATMSNVRIVNYYDVPITENMKLTGIIPKLPEDEIRSIIYNGSTANYELLDSENNHINVSEELRGDNAQNAQHTVTVSAGNDYGMVLGGGIFTQGNFAQAEAYPLVGSSLIGWYNDGELVSTDEVYRFSVTKDINLVAKFAEVEKYDLTFTATTGGTITNVEAQYTEGTQVSVEAIPNKGYSFVGWSADSGVFENKKKTTTWFTVPDSNVEIKATFKKKSTGGGGGGGGSSRTKLPNVTSDVKDGMVNKGTKVTLSNTNDKAIVYYTTDGSTPTSKSTKYTTPIIINDDVTIKAIATNTAYITSDVATFKYEVNNEPMFKLKENADEIKYMSSYPDGSFKPDQAATRYEILTALNNLFDFVNIKSEMPFSDVNNSYKELVNKFVCTDVIEGYEDKTFRGENGITRAELVKILSIMFEIEDKGYTADNYSDISNHWAKTYINTYAKSGYVNGYPDGTFKPDNQVTRAEFVKIVNNILGISSTVSSSIETEGRSSNITYNSALPDIAEHWAKNDIEAVTR